MTLSKFTLALVAFVFGISTIAHAHCDLVHLVKSSTAVSIELKAPVSGEEGNKQASDTSPTHFCFSCTHSLIYSQYSSILKLDTNISFYNPFRDALHKQDFFPKLKRPPRA